MRFTNRQILKIAGPILVSVLMEHLIGMTDTAFLGRVGEVELGASALAGVYYLAIFMLGFGFSTGVQIMIGRRNGEGNYTAIGELFNQGFVFQFLLATFIFFATRFGSPLLLRHLIDSPQVYEATLEYMNRRIFGLFFSFTALMFRAFYVGIADTRTLTANSLVMVGTNVVLNYILIFGKLGFPALGIAGAAIASVLAEVTSLLFFIVYTGLKIDRQKYRLYRFHRIEIHLLKRILGISIWTMVQAFISISTWFLFFIAVEHLGERPLAITNVLRNISSLFFIIVSAFATTASSLVSNLIGAGEQDCVRGTIKQHIRIGYIFVLPILVFFCLFPDLILRIYTDIPDLRAASVPSLWVLCSAYLVLVPANVYFQSVSGTGNTRTALAMELCVLAIYVTYSAYFIMYLQMDVAFAWTTECVYGTFILLFCYWYMKKGNWQKKKI